MATKAEPSRPGFLSRVLRRARRIVLYAVLLAAALVVYLHQAGLPDFVKASIVQQLRARGLDLDYGRIVLRWYDGIVAEQVSLVQVGQGEGAQLLLPEIAFRLDPSALLRMRVVVASMELRNGRVVVPVNTTNEVSQVVSLDRLSAELRFAGADTWHLENLSGECLGVRLQLRANLTNASALRSWRLPFSPQPGREPLAWEVPLHRFLQNVRQLEFSQPPTLDAVFSGDAAKPEALRARVHFGANESRAPWGTLESLRATLQLNEQVARSPEGQFRLQIDSRNLRLAGGWRLGRVRLDSRWTQPLTNPVPDRLAVDLALDDLETVWGRLSDLHLVGGGQQRAGEPGTIDVQLRLAGGSLAGDLGRSGATDFQLTLVQDLESFLPQSGAWKLQLSSPTFAWGRAEQLDARGYFELRDSFTRSAVASSNASPAAWQVFAPWRAGLIGSLDRLVISNTPIDHLQLEAAWDAPRLRVTRLEGELAERRFQGEGELDVPSRALKASASLDFDLHHVDELLPDGARRWLARYQWQAMSPPVVGARVWLTLPPLAQLDTTAALAQASESLRLEGKLVAADVGYQGVAMDTVAFDFAFTNQVWHLTDFIATAPEGRFAMEYREHQHTRDYRFDIEAELDPRVFRALVPEPERQAFGFFDFAEPPQGRGFVQGRYGYPELTEFGGTLRTGPFVFRGEPIESLEAQLRYTNGWVRASDLLLRSEGMVQAREVAFDTAGQRLSLEGVQSSVSPMRVARAIGDEVVEILSPYVFEVPPEATVQGWLNVRDTREVDLRFDLKGGPFRYWRFRLPQIEGMVVWSNETVRLLPLRAEFYRGTLSGEAEVDLAANPGADIRFSSRFEDVDFAPLMADLLSPTNRFEGRIGGVWTLTHANSEDWNSWNGWGHVELRDGYLWDLPLFGVGTTIMDNLRIDAGRSRVKGLVADFTMTNSLIYTDNLELTSAAMRLDYRGTFDFEGRVNAQVEARLLHETAVVGPLVSLLFAPLTKMFMYKVEGSLDQPKLEPLYVPKPLLFPINPIGTLKEMFRPAAQDPSDP